jgi:signal transduction histidine kinase
LQARLLAFIKYENNITMKNKSLSPTKGLQAAVQRLEEVRQQVKQLPVQPDQLSEVTEKIFLIEEELQAGLEKLSRQNDELISLLSHELLTPLTLIQGPLHLLATERLGSLSEEGQYLLKVAVKNADHLVRLVRELLTFKRIESGQLKLLRQSCNAAELMKQAATMVQLKAEQAGVILSIEPIHLAIWVDPDHTLLILVHLLSNAIKFSSPGCRVCLTASPFQEDDSQQTFVLFQVKDRGMGIPPDQLEAVFDCFQQVDSSDSRPKGGLGLGLALCRQIVQQQGGRLWAKSALGVGSTFFFTLPVLDVDRPQLTWWVEIQTNVPRCTYYFGPFENAKEARLSQVGYLEDLLEEKARGITVEIKQCQPEKLTIFDEEETKLISREGIEQYINK